MDSGLAQARHSSVEDRLDLHLSPARLFSVIFWTKLKEKCLPLTMQSTVIMLITRARKFGKMPFQMQWTSLQIKSESVRITSLWLKCYNFILPFLPILSKCLIYEINSFISFVSVHIFEHKYYCSLLLLNKGLHSHKLVLIYRKIENTDIEV